MVLLKIIISPSILKGNSTHHFEKLLVEALREKWFFFFPFSKAVKSLFFG